jgi:hypothetical protein
LADEDEQGLEPAVNNSKQLEWALDNGWSVQGKNKRKRTQCLLIVWVRPKNVLRQCPIIIKG